MLLRLARRRDLQAIARFAEVVVHDTYDPLIGPEGARRVLDWWGQPLAEAVDLGHVHVAVACGDGDIELVGLVERGVLDGEPVVWKLYVAPTWRNRGIGPRLLQVAEGGIGPGHDRLLLEHIASNERAARFYERHGLTVLRRERSDDPEHDLVWRSRQLGGRVDDYASTAELHEVHMDAVWDELGDVVTVAFGALPPDGVIVDVGAGSGAGVVVVAERTACEIIAIEPSPTMRAMLMARLAAAGLLDRVTVLADAVPAALERVPDRVDGVVAGHMLGHLTSDDRHAVLDWTAAHLRERGAALLTVSGAGTPDPDAVHVEERRVGRHLHRAAHHAPDAHTYESSFEVLDGEEVIRSVVVTGSWERITADDVRARVVSSDLDVAEPRPGVVVLRR
ncbi:MAG: bifunctional GNAT family N-acetyltransferase/class I SAM-dependent methyltransferase [Actinomycetota bacterium]